MIEQGETTINIPVDKKICWWCAKWKRQGKSQWGECQRGREAQVSSWDYGCQFVVKK